jgi:hypothetical protein
MTSLPFETKEKEGTVFENNLTWVERSTTILLGVLHTSSHLYPLRSFNFSNCDYLSTPVVTLKSLPRETLIEILDIAGQGSYVVLSKLQTVCKMWANCCGEPICRVALKAYREGAFPIVCEESLLMDSKMAKTLLLFRKLVKKFLNFGFGSTPSTPRSPRSPRGGPKDKINILPFSKSPDDNIVEILKPQILGGLLSDEGRLMLYCSVYYNLLAPEISFSSISFEGAYRTLYTIHSKLSKKMKLDYVSVTLKSYHRLLQFRLTRLESNAELVQRIEQAYLHHLTSQDMFMFHSPGRSLSWIEIEAHFLQTVLSQEIVKRVASEVARNANALSKWNSDLLVHYERCKANL